MTQPSAFEDDPAQPAPPAPTPPLPSSDEAPDPWGLPAGNTDAGPPDASLLPPAEAPPPVPLRRRRKKKAQLPFWKEFPILVGIALVFAVLIKTFLVQAFYIPSQSMEPTIVPQDRVLVNKLAYVFGDIERGDIVVFDNPEQTGDQPNLIVRAFRSIGEAIGISSAQDHLIKRVIGLPGETIEIRDNQVIIDGKILDESAYLPEGIFMPDRPPFTLGPEEYFMMGDNRNNSSDSRVFGPVQRGEIVGQAFIRVWPLNRIALVR